MKLKNLYDDIDEIKFDEDIKSSNFNSLKTKIRTDIEDNEVNNENMRYGNNDSMTISSNPKSYNKFNPNINNNTNIRHE